MIHPRSIWVVFIATFVNATIMQVMNGANTVQFLEGRTDLLWGNFELSIVLFGIAMSIMSIYGAAQVIILIYTFLNFRRERIFIVPIAGFFGWSLVMLNMVGGWYSEAFVTGVFLVIFSVVIIDSTRRRKRRFRKRKRYGSGG